MATASEWHSIELCHVADAPLEHDSYRVLIERSWPRGVTTEQLPVDAWMKGLAPSAELRRLLRSTRRWDEFRSRYLDELRRDAGWTVIAKVLRDRPVLLLYAAPDRRFNHAVVLKGLIEQELAAGRESQLDIATDQPTTGGNPPGTVGPPHASRHETAAHLSEFT